MSREKKGGFLSPISFFLLFLDKSKKHFTTFRGPTAVCLRRKRRKLPGKINRGEKIRIRNHLDIIKFPSRKVDTK